MDQKLITYNSIETQFKLLCYTIHYNVVIVDEAKGLAFVALYHNKLTGKVNGFFIDKVNSTRLSNAIRWFCSRTKQLYTYIQKRHITTTTRHLHEDKHQ